ncbi:acyltransferase [Aromatoleum bremense]|uniref:Acyltransferase n=1 Tax=Aromatoleum bremense TaxID=76115 RepID=A0ABX1NXA1_9RHOO|nr:acyltransferase [Aromatoleum bremense]NMG16644.1 acyltransferase [Aromatoleum bremense]
MGLIERVVWILKKLIAVVVFRFRGKIAANRLLGVKIGNGCSIYTLLDGTEPFLIEIGDRVTITEGVVVLTHDGATRLVRKPSGSRCYRYGRVIIESDVFVGVRSIIMPGVTIGRESVVAAGSVVTASVPPGSVVAGAPARVISSIQAYREKICRTCTAGDELVPYSTYRDKVIATLNNG